MWETCRLEKTKMVVVLHAYKNKISSNNSSVATMKDYYNGNADQQKEWNNSYMDMYLSRKVIIGSNNRDIQKDLDKGVRLGNTYYPNELKKASGLTLQYNKENEREQLYKEKYKDKYDNNKVNKNNNNSNNVDNNDGDDGKNDDKTKIVGAIIDIDNKIKKQQYQHSTCLTPKLMKKSTSMNGKHNFMKKAQWDNRGK